MSNGGHYEQQGEHQTILESVSYVPAEESTNMNCSEDFGSQIEKLTEHNDMANSLSLRRHLFKM